MEFRAADPIRWLEGSDLLVYDEPKANHEYIMCVDVSKGRGQDYSTFNLIDISVSPFRQVAVYRNNNISPLLFPDIIYKYAILYNNAYVVVESNDQGTLVTRGLYYDLEYENLHMESAIKADKIGVEITRKTKRLGCSSIKDILENGKLVIQDHNTIMEISTFIARGQTYEASAGNHDDLMMNLVMFGYFANTTMFRDMTDINLREMMYKDKISQIEADMMPFGIIDDGVPDEVITNQENDHSTGWALDTTDRFF